MIIHACLTAGVIPAVTVQPPLDDRPEDVELTRTPDGTARQVGAGASPPGISIFVRTLTYIVVVDTRYPQLTSSPTSRPHVL
jgi:hypothetical protein